MKTNFDIKVDGTTMATSTPEKRVTLPTPATAAAELAGQIEYLNGEYRQGNPQVSDQEYDSMLERLALLDPEHPILKKGVIERAPTGGRMRKLARPMMSLNKLKTVASVMEWLSGAVMTDDDAVVLTPKYNGISLQAYCGSRRYWASTRGDGVEGQNCDAHFAGMNYPIHSHYEGLLGGEAVISKATWKKHFEGRFAPSGLPYKLNNATVAGLLNNDSPTDALRHVSFVPYNMLDDDGSKTHQMLKLHETFSTTAPFFMTVKIKDLTEELFDDCYQQWGEIWPIDGIVIDLDRANLRRALGTETNGNPAYARALKLGKWTEEFDTVITGYDLNVSKQGKLKGTVTFEPLTIMGTEVKQATFHNALFLHDFSLTPGIRITVKKSGEIIPKIVAVEGVRVPSLPECKSQSDYDQQYAVATDQIDHIVGERRMNGEIHFDWDFFAYCPSCGGTTHWDSNNVELICDNKECPDVRLAKAEHFFLALGVEEFGRPSIKTLFDAGFDTIEKIFGMTRAKMAAIEGFGDASAELVVRQFDKIRRDGASMARLMYAWDLFDGKLGEKTAQLALDNVRDLNLVYLCDLIRVKGISDATGSTFIAGLERLKDMPQIVPISHVNSPSKQISSEKFANFSVCFSGIRDKALEARIEDGSGKIASGVSKNTTHLIVADTSQNTGKTASARSLGIPIMTIAQFEEAYQ